MEVAPYSPRALAKESTMPARISLRQTGIRTLQKIQVPDFPKVFPASARVSSKLSKAPRAVRYIRGKITTAVERIAAYQVIVRRIPKCCRKNAPTGCFGPATRSSRNPTTVGGRTRGSVRTTSRMPLRILGIFAM